MNILVIIKVKILMLIKWSCWFPSIVFIIELKLGYHVLSMPSNVFLTHVYLISVHVSLKCRYPK